MDPRNMNHIACIIYIFLLPPTCAFLHTKTQNLSQEIRRLSISNLQTLPTLQTISTILSSSSSPSVKKILKASLHSNKDANQDTQRRKEKKNKYANFSKADQRQLDPLEAMIAESKQKNQEISKEKLQSKKDSINPQQRANAAKYAASNNEDSTNYESTNMHFPDTRSIDPYDPTTYGFTELGTILGAHGVKGEMKISASTGFGKERLCQAGIRHLKMPNRRSPREVILRNGRYQMEHIFLIEMEGVEDRDAAKRLRGAILYAKETERPEDVEEDEFMISELVGLEVFLDEKYVDDNFDDENKIHGVLGSSSVGKVSGIVLSEEMCTIPGLGNDLLEICLPRGQGGLPSWKDELVLIPFVPDIVPRVDLLAKEIYIAPPPGLLDLTYFRQDNVRIKGFLPPAKDD